MASYLIPVTADGGFIQAVPVGETPVEYATESDITTAISNLVDTAPTALNTLNELAAALGDDANYASTITTALGNKADTSSLATVATSGSYTDLSNKPTIPTNTNQLTNGAGFLTSVGTISYNDLSNKPALFSGSYADLTSKPTLFSGSYTDLTSKPTIPTNTNQLTNGAGFITSNGIPSQSGNSGKYLTTNGSAVSWATVSGGGGTDYSTVTEIAIGYESGPNGGNGPQGTSAIAVGNRAGWNSQSPYSVAIGHWAGMLGIGNAAVAIGLNSAAGGLGAYSVAIGAGASQNQAGVSNSIVLNASGNETNATASGFFVNPIRSGSATSECLYYDSSTREVIAGPVPSGGGGSGGGGATTDWYSITATSGGSGVTTLTAPVGLDISMTNSANPKLFVGGEDMSYPSGIAPFSPPSMDWMENMGQSINSYSYNGMEAPLSIAFDTVAGGVRWAMAPSCISGEICYVQYMPSNRNSSAVNYFNGLSQLPQTNAATSEVHGITMIGSGSLVTATAVNCTIHESIQGYGYTYVVWSMTKTQSDAVNSMADMMTLPGTYTHFTYYWFKQPL
jgi:hypothetical protein